MQRIELILSKIETIETLNRGEEIKLANPKIAVTSMFNNILRTMIDSWPVRTITREEVEDIWPVLKRWMDVTDDRPLDLDCLKRALNSGLDDFVPFLIARYLLRNKNLSVSIRHTTPEWREFYSLYGPVFAKMDEIGEHHERTVDK